MAFFRHIAAAAIFLSLLPAQPEAAAETTSTKCAKRFSVGVSLPLGAGPISSGEAVRDSILLADELYDSGDCVRFLFEDDGLLAKNTISVVNRFIDFEKVGGLIVYGTPTSIAAGPLAESSRTPMMALSILPKVVEGKSYVVKHWCTSERLNDAVAAEVARRGYKSVAVVSTETDAMIGLRDLFVPGHKALIRADDLHMRDVSDFRTTISRIVRGKADAVYVLLYPPQTAPFMKQLRALGYKGDAFGVHNIEDPHEVAAAAGAMEGMWFANGDESAGEDYPDKFEKRFGKKTALGGASGFDAAKLYIGAAASRAEVNEYLHTVKDFRGAFGTYSAAASNDFDIPAVIKTVRGGRFERISKLK